MKLARHILAALVLLVPASALAQFGPDFMGTVRVFGSAPAFLFTAPAAGDYATLTAATGQTISCSRASTGTIMTSPTALATVASGHCRVDYRGCVIEEASTNLALRSGDMSNPAWGAQHSAIVGNQCVFPDGTTTMAKVTSTDTVGAIFQAVTVSTVGPFTESAWAAAVSGTIQPSITMERTSGTVWSTCTCTAEQGATCSATINGLDCMAAITSTIGTTPVRFSVSGSTSTAATQIALLYAPGTYNGASDTGAVGCFGGAQFEALGHPSLYIPTAGTSAARPADVVSLTKPASLTMTTANYSVSATGLAGTLDATLQHNFVGTNQNVTGDIRISTATNVQAYNGTPGFTASFAVVSGSTLVSRRYAMQWVAATKTESLYVGGAFGASNSETGVQTEPTTIFLGSDRGTTGYLDGFLTAVCYSTSLTGCAP